MQSHIAARLEAGSGLTPGLDHIHPANELAAFDITVISPLTPAILVYVSARVLLLKPQKGELKHTANDLHDICMY